MAPKFLFLHGFGESNMLASNSTSTLMEVLKPEGITLDSMDGFTKLENESDFEPIPDQEYKDLCKNKEIDAYCWYPMVPKQAMFNKKEGGKRAGSATNFAYQPSSAEAVKKGVDALIKYIEKVNGVDAIIGFSQGGELAYFLMENMSSMTLASQAKLKFIATFGSEDSFLNAGKKMPKLTKNIAFYLCYGDKDDDAVHDCPSMAKSLTAAGAKEVTLKKIADHGHNMPKDKDVYADMLKEYRKAEKKAAVPDGPVKPEKPEYWCVLTDPEGRCSMGRSDTKPVKPGSKFNDQWTIVAADFLEEEAKLYVRNNWKDMTPKSVADGHRKWDHPKYKDYTPEQYDALWTRDTIDEFRKKAPAYREAEKIKEEAEKVEAAKKKAEMEAKKAEDEKNGVKTEE